MEEDLQPLRVCVREGGEREETARAWEERGRRQERRAAAEVVMSGEGEMGEDEMRREKVHQRAAAETAGHRCLHSHTHTHSITPASSHTHPPKTNTAVAVGGGAGVHGRREL